MKKILVVLLVLSLITVPVIAQSATPKIKAYVILGLGIAASPSDPMDFMIVKFGIGRVILKEVDLVLGVLKVDEEKYILRKIVIEEGHVTGNIYKTGKQVGSFDISSVTKEDIEIWAGTMNLNGNNYHLYVIEGVRPIKAGELKDKVADYCRNSTDTNCRGKIHEYCENNPEDSRCKALFRAYCLKSNNMDDTRCRLAFRNWCKDHPSNKHCVPFALKRAKKYCEEHSDSNLCKKIATNVADLCEDNPDNEGCAAVKQIVKEKPDLLKKVQSLRTRISNLKNRAKVKSAEATSADVVGGS